MSFRLALNSLCSIKDDPELLTLLRLPLGCWDYRHISILSLYMLGLVPRALCMPGEHAAFILYARVQIYFLMPRGGVKRIQIYSHLCYNTTCVFIGMGLKTQCSNS